MRGPAAHVKLYQSMDRVGQVARHIRDKLLWIGPKGIPARRFEVTRKVLARTRAHHDAIEAGLARWAGLERGLADRDDVNRPAVQSIAKSAQ